MRILVKTDISSVSSYQKLRMLPLSISLEGRIKGGEVELQDDQATVRALFEELSEELSKGYPKSTQGGPFEYLVLVNDGDWQYLSECLETQLKEGDKVTITMGLRMAGGG